MSPVHHWSEHPQLHCPIHIAWGILFHKGAPTVTPPQTPSQTPTIRRPLRARGVHLQTSSQTPTIKRPPTLEVCSSCPPPPPRPSAHLLWLRAAMDAELGRELAGLLAMDPVTAGGPGGGCGLGGLGAAGPPAKPEVLGSLGSPPRGPHCAGATASMSTSELATPAPAEVPHEAASGRAGAAAAAVPGTGSARPGGLGVAVAAPCCAGAEALALSESAGALPPPGPAWLPEAGGAAELSSSRLSVASNTLHAESRSAVVDALLLHLTPLSLAEATRTGGLGPPPLQLLLTAPACGGCGCREAEVGRGEARGAG